MQMSQSNSNKKGKSGGQETVHDVLEVSCALTDTYIGKRKKRKNIQNIRNPTGTSIYTIFQAQRLLSLAAGTQCGRCSKYVSATIAPGVTPQA